jgi:hypothetical protein
MYKSLNFEQSTTNLTPDDREISFRSKPKEKTDHSYQTFLSLWETLNMYCPELRVDFCQTAQEKRELLYSLESQLVPDSFDIHTLRKSIKNPKTWLMKVSLSKEIPQYISKPNSEAFWDIIDSQEQLIIERINPEGEHFWGEEGDEYYLLACTYNK